LPAIGKCKVEAVERQDIEMIAKALTAKGMLHQSNQVLQLCNLLFAKAIEWGWRSAGNPASGIQRHKLEGRERYLKDDETHRLIAAIEVLEDRQAADILTVLLLTGSRIGETCKMTWKHLDFEERVWRKPSSVTKSGRAHRVPLVPEVIAILSKIRAGQAKEGEWVFPGSTKLGYRVPVWGPKAGKPPYSPRDAAAIG